jgi:hypothetical protein
MEFNSPLELHNSLVHFLRKEEHVRDILEPYTGGHYEWTAADWFQGLCLTLAVALWDWLGFENAEIYSLEDRESEEIEHVALKVGDIFIDGHGLSSAQDLLHSWNHKSAPGIVMPESDTQLAPFDIAKITVSGLSWEPDIAKLLANCLKDNLDPKKGTKQLKF